MNGGLENTYPAASASVARISDSDVDNDGSTGTTPTWIHEIVSAHTALLPVVRELVQSLRMPVAIIGNLNQSEGPIVKVTASLPPRRENNTRQLSGHIRRLHMAVTGNTGRPFKPMEGNATTASLSATLGM